MGENNSNETTDKGLISKIYKQLIQLDTRKTNNPIQTWEKDLNRYFAKEDTQITNKHMKRCSTLLIIQFSSVTQSCPVLCNSVDCSPLGFSVHGDSPGKNTGVGSYALLQGILPTQGSNPGLLNCRQILYHLSHQGSLKMTTCRYKK